MNVFVLDKILKNINDATIKIGNEYFLLNKVNDITYKLKNDIYAIDSKCNNYHCHIDIVNNEIKDFSCECSQYKYKVICKHIIATLFKFNEQINIDIKNKVNFSNLNLSNNIIDIYKKIIESDYLLCLEFSNNSLQIIYYNQFFFNDIIENFNQIKRAIDLITDDNLSNQKVKRIIYEIELLKEYGIFNRDFYQGEELDAFIELLKNHKFEYVSILLKKNNINNIKVVDLKKDKIELKCEYFKTTFNYILTTNITLLDFIYSSDHTYLFLKLDNEDILYKVDYEDVKRYKILKSNYIDSKNKMYITSKIELLNSFNIFNFKLIDHTKDIEDKKIDLVLEYDVNNKKIILQTKANFVDEKLINEMLIKKFNKYVEKNYNFKQHQFIFNNNIEFDEFINKFKSDETFNFIYPKYFNDHKYDFDIEFNIDDNNIEFNLNNDVINSPQKFDKLKKATLNQETFIEIDNNIYLVKNFNLNQLQKQFEKYNINKISYTNNIIDFKNIFLLSDEINDQKIISYMNRINQEEVTLQIKDEISSILKPYQMDGIKWVKKKLKLFNGCILADEMGLGKTLQTLALLDDYFASNPTNKNILIITPSILLKNWLLEIKKFNFDLDVIVLNGNKQNRINLLNKNINNNKILLTTYNQLVNDYSYIKNLHFEYIILDEGQKIKNFNSATSKKIRSLSSLNRIILSGTPIENNLLELWTIFDFILPNFLLPYSKFRKKYHAKSTDPKDFDILNLQTSPFILKRTKNDNLTLPTKTIEDIFIKMSDNEKKEYLHILEKVKLKFSRIDKNDSINILSILTSLRMYCCWNEHGASKQEKLFSLIKEIIPTKNKIIIFCFFSSILEKISIDLSEMGIKNLLLIGKTNNRWNVINEFYNSDTQILLCSLKTGGIGLNLTNANYVINYSPWWNESSENQAIDRVHRIGQNKNVIVKNLLLEDTIEIDIFNLKKQKSVLIDNIINDIDYYELLNKILYKDKNE